MSLPKTMENNSKMWTFEEPNKIYIVGKVLMGAIRNLIFIEFELLCQKLWAFMSIYQNHSPNMVMSRDPGLQIPKMFIFRLILY